MGVIQYYKDEEISINQMPFEDYDDFCSSSRHYIDLADIAGLEGERFEITI